MRTVLHVGPCTTPGGMATVMKTLADHPPEGWEAELLPSHAPRGAWAKWTAYRNARRTLSKRCASSNPPDAVHVHAASDWSLRRKLRLVRLVRRFGVPVVLHLHSGKLATWMGSADSKRARTHRLTVARLGVQQVVLSEEWQRILSPVIGPVEAVVNPVPPHCTPGDGIRDANHVLVLGRDDPVKGHGFAERVMARLVEHRPEVHLSMTGKASSSLPYINALGWVSEAKKLHLLRSASVLLVPSSVEGQPLVVLEALACGLPVVASANLHSLPDGVVRAGSSVDDWVDAVERVLSGSASHNVDIEPHRLPAVSQRWKTLYGDLLKD